AGSAGSQFYFPTTQGAFQTVFGGYPSDGFVLKIDPTGTSFVYSTFLGGAGYDSGNGIAVGADGTAFVTGETAAEDFPITECVRAYSGRSDAFVTRLSPDGSAAPYSTHVGGADNDAGNAIALDTDGNAYVAGSTSSTDFPAVGALQGPAGGSDAFVTKL